MKLDETEKKKWNKERKWKREEAKKLKKNLKAKQYKKKTDRGRKRHNTNTGNEDLTLREIENLITPKILHEAKLKMDGKDMMIESINTST